MAQDPSGPASAEASSAVPLSAYLALKAELTERNLARVDLLLKESLEDDDGIPEGLDERTADFLGYFSLVAGVWLRWLRHPSAVRRPSFWHL